MLKLKLDSTRLIPSRPWLANLKLAIISPDRTTQPLARSITFTFKSNQGTLAGLPPSIDLSNYKSISLHNRIRIRFESWLSERRNSWATKPTKTLMSLQSSWPALCGPMRSFHFIYEMKSAQLRRACWVRPTIEEFRNFVSKACLMIQTNLLGSGLGRASRTGAVWALMIHSSCQAANKRDDDEKFAPHFSSKRPKPSRTT